MRSWKVLALASVLATVCAADEGHHHMAEGAEQSNSTSGMAMGGAHMHGRPILEDPNLTPEERKFWEAYNTTTFFTSESGSKGVLYTHVALGVLAFGLLAPVAMLVNFAPGGSWLGIPLQIATTAVGVASILFLGLYATSAPDLYPGNIYGGMSFIVLVLILAQCASLLVAAAAKHISPGPLDGPKYMLSTLGRVSGDSQHDSGHDLSDDGTTEEFDIESHGEEDLTFSAPQQRDSLLVRHLASASWVYKIADKFGTFASKLALVLSIFNFLFEYVYVMTGIVIGTRLGMGKLVFGLLAHVIKGSVFFLLGFFELARFLGALSKYGMAWNTLEIDPEHWTNKTSRGRSLHVASSSSWPGWLKFWPNYASIEFWQSFTIFIYGVTNVFLEHLGNEDGTWSHKDIQHVSIAFMFFGGGLCGIALESATLRRLTAHAFGNQYTARSFYGYSINPLPAFVIFWTGALMSKHQQETQLATDVHIEWGVLLCVAALFRGLTYTFMLLRPPTNDQPQRPFTEVITSFCLISGGMIFMLSNKETVRAMEYRGIGAMFILNVGVGVTALLMAYSVFAVGVRGLAMQRH